MEYIAKDLEIRMGSTTGWVGVNEECVSLVRGWTNAPPTAHWIRGAAVKNNTHIQKGTVIATFDGGHYHGHAAIYLGDMPDGIRVYDQWNGQKAHERIIHYGGHHAFVDAGANYYVVE